MKHAQKHGIYEDTEQEMALIVSIPIEFDTL